MKAPPEPVITVRAPFRIARRGGRKLIVTPDGSNAMPRARIDSALVKALARAHRWRRMLEAGEHATIADLARAEKIGRSYVSRALGLAFLAPDLVEAILDGRQGEAVTLEALLGGVPVGWEGQAEWR